MSQQKPRWPSRPVSDAPRRSKRCAYPSTTVQAEPGPRIDIPTSRLLDMRRLAPAGVPARQTLKAATAAFQQPRLTSNPKQSAGSTSS